MCPYWLSRLKLLGSHSIDLYIRLFELAKFSITLPAVLLLNSILTVRENSPRSHKEIKWEWFTKEIIKKLSTKRENLVFLLWGKDAQKNESLINNKKHLILKSGHPSPLSANKGLWFGNKHFSLCNSYLRKNNKKPIDW